MALFDCQNLPIQNVRNEKLPVFMACRDRVRFRDNPKYFYSWDWVVALYILDASMVATDMFLCYYYDWKNKRRELIQNEQ